MITETASKVVNGHLFRLVNHGPRSLGDHGAALITEITKMSTHPGISPN